MSSAVIGNLVSGVTNAITGAESHTGLQDFLSKFSDPAGKYVNMPDPLGTFDVNIKFKPGLDAKTLSKGEKILGALGTAATSAVKNAANNLTGGLASSLLANMPSKKFEKERSGADTSVTFLQYLAQANMLVGGENWFNANQGLTPLELQLGLYVQSVTIPTLKMAEGQKLNTALGEFPTNGGYIAASGELNMDILNTKAALHERIFYPWLREITCPWWSYDTQPYTTATITIDFTKHNDVKYVFCGCRPNSIYALQGTQEADSQNMVRQVSFLFDAMYVKSDLNVMDSSVSKLVGSAGNLLGGAGTAFNI